MFHGIAIAGMILVNIDAGKLRHAGLPFIGLGRNAIAVYVLSSLAGRAMTSFNAGGRMPVKTSIHQVFFASWLDPCAASLSYAAVFLLFWTEIMYVLYRKKTFISV